MSARVDDGGGGWNGEQVEGDEATQVIQRSRVMGIAMVVVLGSGCSWGSGGEEEGKGGKSLTRLSVIPGAGANGRRKRMSGGDFFQAEVKMQDEVLFRLI